MVEYIGFPSAAQVDSMATSVAPRLSVKQAPIPRVLTLTYPHAPGYHGEDPERENPHGGFVVRPVGSDSSDQKNVLVGRGLSL